MDNELSINRNMCAVTENNLGAVLFSDYDNEGLIVAPDVSNGLAPFEGTLCYDESTNELVYVNMIPSNVGNSDLTVPHSVFSSLSNAASLGDLSLFSDGGQVILLGNSSIVIPSDEENLVASNSDPFVLEYVLNTPDNDEKTLISFSRKAPETVVQNEAVRDKIIHNQRDSTQLKTNSISQNSDVPENTTTLESAAKQSEKKNGCDVRYSCKVCPEKFKLLKEYKTHLLCHKDKLHKCKQCGSSFNKVKNLILHEVTHNANNTTCPLAGCEKKFRRVASLKAHMKLHEEEESLTCPECGEEFRNQLYLELHCKYQPQCRIATSVDFQNSNKSYVCKLCDRKFEHISSFVSHKKEHEKIKKALTTKNHKKRTVSSAPSSRINRCKICPKWFLKPSQLLRHMRIHTGERPFECTLCNRAFNQANSLKIHMLKHTGDRPYQCPFCSTGFSQRGNLRQHINRVHSIPKVEERVYECAECSCVFRKLCSLNAHKNRVHQKQCNTSDPGSSSGPVEESITIENGLDDVQDEDFDELLQKKSTVNTITISLPRENGDVWQQEVLVNKKGNERFYRCSHCPKQSLKLREIIRHLKINVCGKSFKCDFCPIKFSQHSTYLTHLALHASAKKYPCDVCEQTFSNPAELKIHTKSHVISNEHQLCMTCFKSYPLSQMNSHPCNSLLQNTDANNQNKTFDSAKVIELRDKVNLILPPYVCNYCNVSFESYLRLKQHLYQSHDANVCELCCLLFPSKKDLEEHTNVNHRDKPNNLMCAECGKQFSTERRRSLHMKSHAKLGSGAGLFPCSRCDKTYTHALSLRRHEKQVHKMNGQKKVENPCSESYQNANGNHDSEAFVNRVNSGVRLNSITNFDVTDNGRVFDSSQLMISGVQSDYIKSNICDIKADSNSSVTENCTVSTLQENSIVDSISSQSGDVDPLADLFEIQTGDISLVESDVDALPSIYNLPGAITYRCTKCLEQYATEIELQKHFQESEACKSRLLNVVNSYFYACNTCFLTFKSLATFLKHLETHEDTKKFSCLFCGVPHKKEGELTRHIALHALNNEYPCMYCGELSDSAESVKQHMTDVHLRSSSNPSKTDLKRRKYVGCELLLTEKEKMILAEQEPNKYSSISEKVLSSLLKKGDKEKSAFLNEDNDETVIKQIKRRNGSNYTPSPNTCDYCSKSFKKRCDLVRHIRTHTGEKPFKCDYCNRYFRVKSILNSHLKTHFTVNNIFCHICNRFFATVGSLKIHMRLHTGDRPYQCSQCNETFRTSGHRDHHQKKHENGKEKFKMDAISHGVMIEIDHDDEVQLALENTHPLDEEFLLSDVTVPENFKFQDIDLSELDSAECLPKPTYTCTVCQKTFKRKQDLDRHSNVHQPEKAYTCMICDDKFNDIGVLKSHLKRHTTSAASVCDICDKTFAAAKNLKVHKIRHHPETLHLPVQDENESNSPHASSSDLIVIEDDEMAAKENKWLHQGYLSLSNYGEKNSILKRNDLSDFYAMDKQLDLNSMIRDLFPEYEK